MRRFILSLFLFLFHASTFADNGNLQIIGTIADGNGKPLAYANVVVFKNNNPHHIIKGAVSGSNGEFAIMVPAQDSLSLQVSYLGFITHSQELNPTKGDVGQIVLSPSSGTLDAVSVRPQLEVTADKIIFNFEFHPERKSSHMLSMITKVPLIYKDVSGEIVVDNTNKKYIVLRNGKRDAMFHGTAARFEEILEKLPAMGFTAFEIWTTPPQRYSSYDYVINIITDKKEAVFGAVGSSQAGYNFENNSSRARQGVDASAEKIRFNLKGIYSYTAPRAEKEMSHAMYHSASGEPQGETLQRQKNKGHTNSYKISSNFSVDMTRKQYLTGSFDLEYDKTSRITELLTDIYSPGLPGESQSTHSRRSGNKRSLDYNLSYQYDFTSSRNLVVSYNGSFSPSRSDRLFSSYDQSANRTENENYKLNESFHSFDIDYTDGFGKGKYVFTTGVNYLLSEREETTSLFDLIDKKYLVSAPGMESDFSRILGYAAFKWVPSRVFMANVKLTGDFLPGGSITKYHFESQTERVKQSGTLLSPSAGFSYRFKLPSINSQKVPEDPVMAMMAAGTGGKNSSIDIRYNIERRRPSAQILSLYSDPSNPYFIKVGNPDLKNEMLHNVSLRFSPGVLPSSYSLSFSVTYRFSGNMISSVSTREDTPDGSVVRTSHVNSAKMRGVMGSLILMQMSSGIRFICFMNHTRWVREGEANKYTFLTPMLSYSFKKIPYVNIQTQLTYVYNHSGGSEEYDPGMPVALGIYFYSKELRIKENPLRFSLSTSNVLRWKYKSSRSTYWPDFTQFSESRRPNIAIEVTAGYTFGKFRVRPVKSIRTNNPNSGFSSGADVISK